MEDIPSFGYWLRRRRKALDLTQEELARRLGYTVATIKKIETDARRPSRQLAERLADLLEIAPQERGMFLKVARAELSTGRLATSTRLADPSIDFALLRPPAQCAHNLPEQPTILLGREQELAQVSALLRRPDVRLVTLTGPGGVGKTRLALQVATELLADVADGVFFVTLAPIRAPDSVLPAIANTLGVRKSGAQSTLDSLKDTLRDKQLVLLLDNFEQVIDAAPQVRALLAAAPGLKVLATGRMALRISGEHEIGVPPLALPDRQHLPPLEILERCPTVALFIARSQAIKPDFALTQENARAVAEICIRLDGLPLAIELAAVRSKLLSPQAMLSRLSSRLTLLTHGGRDLPSRQQTLRSTIDWSYALLSAAEQRLFVRLAIFVGGCTLEGAEAVCQDPRLEMAEPGWQGGNHFSIAEPLDAPSPTSSLDRMASLVDQSMLRQISGADGEPRFVMLETIKEYALERLAAREEAEMIRRRYAAYYLALAEAAEPELIGPDQEIWLVRLEEEHENLRMVLAWALEQGEIETALRLGGALGQFWHARGYPHEGRQWLTAALAKSPALLPPHTQDLAQVNARAFGRAGKLAVDQGDYTQAIELYEESLKCWRVAGARAGFADTLKDLGIVATILSDYTRAIGLHAESLTLFQDLGDKRGMATALMNLGIPFLYQGNYMQASRFFDESLRLYRELADKRGIAFAISGLGGVAWLQGDGVLASRLFRRSLELGQKLGDKRSIALFLNYLGLTLLAEASYPQARTYFTLSLTLHQELGDKEGIIWNLEGLAAVDGAQGNLAWAMQLFRTTEALRTAIGILLPPIVRSFYTRILAAAGMRLDSANGAVGEELTLEQAIAYANRMGQPE